MKPCNLINAISIPLWLNDNYLLNIFQQDVLDKFSHIVHWFCFVVLNSWGHLRLLFSYWLGAIREEGVDCTTLHGYTIDKEARMRLRNYIFKP